MCVGMRLFITKLFSSQAIVYDPHFLHKMSLDDQDLLVLQKEGSLINMYK